MNTPPIPVFLDTDIGPDCDDTAALAILLQLCREGEARLLGVTHCTGSPYGLGTIDAICRMFGVQVPMGTCNTPDFLADGPALCYTPSVCGKFPHAFPPGAAQPDAVEAFVQAMEGAAQDSVTMITIGPLNNLARFLTHPRAAQRMHRCVSRIVMMAGTFDGDFTEWNVEMDVPAMRAVVQAWKKELILCPFEAAADVLAGAPLMRYPDNPVRTAYSLFNKGGLTRPAWDLAAVACAVLADTGPYALSAPGRLTVSERGVTRLAQGEPGSCRIVRRTGTAAQAQAWLDGMLERALQTMTKERREAP